MKNKFSKLLNRLLSFTFNLLPIASILFFSYCIIFLIYEKFIYGNYEFIIITIPFLYLLTKTLKWFSYWNTTLQVIKTLAFLIIPILAFILEVGIISITIINDSYFNFIHIYNKITILSIKILSVGICGFLLYYTCCIFIYMCGVKSVFDHTDFVKFKKVKKWIGLLLQRK